MDINFLMLINNLLFFRYSSLVHLVFWLARSNISFHSLEDEHLLLYHQSLSAAPPPAAKTVAAMIKTVAKAVREQVNTYLQTMKAFSITTDAWTDISLRKFISITYHCIDPVSMEFVSFPCDMLHVPESHTWYQITNTLRKAVDSHFETALLTTVVTDNGANFVKMSIALLQNLGKEDIEGIGIGPNDWVESVENLNDFECLGWRCVAHTMQLAVLDVLKENAPSDVSAVINVVRDITLHIRRSAALRAKLHDFQKRAGRSIKVPLIDCPTRWSTIFYILLRFDQLYVDYRNMALLGLFDNVEFEIPSATQMCLIRDIIDCLKPSEKFIRKLEGDKYVTISHVPTLLHDCLTSLGEITTGSEANSMVDLANSLWRSIKKRLGFILELPNLALCAAALDPRYGHLTFVSPQLRNEVWDTIAQWAFDYNEVFEQTEDEEASSTTFPIPRNANSNVSLQRLKDELNSFRGMFENSSDKMEKIECPLDYWKYCFEQSLACRCLKPLVLSLFCIPASSVK